ncbi:V-type ATP synthase subunit D [Oceanidesulfovibrio marinus]|uniref:V-type ATP synthase subunit D n=1 Tax=Oceanidesulfovibrio marinus TaxID=370038 RepID=A0A6P1ZDV3_9BACT|nr:V-type ATP synthase subunit D [Oceanidesulfovibrio marinus]TVM32724.1 V-type ATP synthase subunit D [Oceanidesulfovibrio marinus]
MAKIKFTKNELKNQRDALGRYERFLPTLRLKKEQLQGEVRRLSRELRDVRTRIDALEDEVRPWIALFDDPYDLAPFAAVERLDKEVVNVVGVNVTELRGVVFARALPDLHDSPAWVDEAVQALRTRVELWMAERFLTAERATLAEELRTTTQRVNLFEKVKIPETLDNIRRIRIFLGDQQTAAVARAKLTKRKTSEQWRSA